MSKKIFLQIIMCLFVSCTEAQNPFVPAVEFADKMKIFNEKVENRKNEYKKNLFYDSWNERVIIPNKISKDSLRHFFAGNGMNDFNFEFFQVTLKDIGELDESFIQQNCPKLYSLMSDSLYNKIVYCYDENNSGITVSIVISKNVVEINDEKEGKIAQGAGYYSEQITFKGKSNVYGIFFTEDEKYQNIVANKAAGRQPVDMDRKNGFQITVDVSTHASKYIGIENENGEILSIIRIY